MTKLRGWVPEILESPTAGYVLRRNLANDGWELVSIGSIASSYTNENAQDAVGNILVDSATIDFVYDDAGNTITANLIGGTPAPADATYLTLSTNATLTNERVFTPGTGLAAIVDGGAGTTATLNHSNSIGATTVFSANLTVDSTGHATALTGNALNDYTGGLIINSGQPVAVAQTVNNAYTQADLFYSPETGIVYSVLNNGTNGALHYIDRVTDSPVLLVAYTGKRTQWGIYSPVSGLFYISYTNAFMSVNAATGAIVTAPITGVKADAGGAIRTSTGHIYTVTRADKVIYQTNPSTDLIVGTGPTMTNFPIQENAITYCPTNDCMYIQTQFGAVERYDCATNTIAANFAVSTGGTTRGSIRYSAETDLIYVVNAAGTNAIRTIAPGADSVVNTYTPPPGLTTSVAGSSMWTLHEHGDYFYIGTSAATNPCSMALIFKKASATFVGSLRLSGTTTSLTGLGIAGVVAERVMYIGNAQSQVGAGVGSTLYTYRMT